MKNAMVISQNIYGKEPLVSFGMIIDECAMLENPMNIIPKGIAFGHVRSTENVLILGSQQMHEHSVMTDKEYADQIRNVADVLNSLISEANLQGLEVSIGVREATFDSLDLGTKTHISVFVESVARLF